MTKYYSPVYTNKDKEPSWFKDFENNLKKTSEYSSIHDEIHSIISGVGKSKFSSVEEIVNDLQERTGFKNFINSKIALDQDGNECKKNANMQEPEEFKLNPEMKIFIDNYVEDRPGTSVDAVIHNMLNIRSIKNGLYELNDVSDSIKKYISNKILEVNLNNQNHHNISNIGKVDVNQSNEMDNENPLAFCEPSKVGGEKFKFIKF